MRTSQILVLCFIQFNEALQGGIIWPFIPFAVRRWGAKPEEVGAYVGIIATSFYLAQFLVFALWGKSSEVWGRRPTLLWGLLGTSVSMALFGFAESFEMALFARFMTGALNGNNAITKTYMGEVVEPENVARGFSYLSFCWGLGAIIAPSLGGLLAEPATVYPAVFGDSALLLRYPYLLPSLVSSCFAFVAWTVGFFFLPETEVWKRRREAVQRRNEVAQPAAAGVELSMRGGGGVGTEAARSFHDKHSGNHSRPSSLALNAPPSSSNGSASTTSEASPVGEEARRRNALENAESDASLSSLSMAIDIVCDENEADAGEKEGGRGSTPVMTRMATKKILKAIEENGNLDNDDEHAAARAVLQRKTRAHSAPLDVIVDEANVSDDDAFEVSSNLLLEGKEDRDAPVRQSSSGAFPAIISTAREQDSHIDEGSEASAPSNSSAASSSVSSSSASSSSASSSSSAVGIRGARKLGGGIGSHRTQSKALDLGTPSKDVAYKLSAKRGEGRAGTTLQPVDMASSAAEEAEDAVGFLTTTQTAASPPSPSSSSTETAIRGAAIVNAIPPPPTTLYGVLRDCSIMTAIICYSLLALSNIIFEELNPVISSLDPAMGGFGFSVATVGFTQIICGVTIILNQLFFFPWLSKRSKRYGSLEFFKISCLFLMGLVFTPAIGRVRDIPGLFWSLIIFNQIYKTVFFNVTFTTIMIVINNSSRGQALGIINGVAMAIASLARIVGPSLGGAIFSLTVSGVKKDDSSTLLYMHLPYLLLSLVAFGTYIAGRHLPAWLNNAPNFADVLQPSVSVDEEEDKSGVGIADNTTDETMDGTEADGKEGEGESDALMDNVSSGERGKGLSVSGKGRVLPPPPLEI